MVETREFSLENLVLGHSTFKDVLGGWMQSAITRKRTSFADEAVVEGARPNERPRSIDRSVTHA